MGKLKRIMCLSLMGGCGKLAPGFPGEPDTLGGGQSLQAIYSYQQLPPRFTHGYSIDGRGDIFGAGLGTMHVQLSTPLLP